MYLTFPFFVTDRISYFSTTDLKTKNDNNTIIPLTHTQDINHHLSFIYATVQTTTKKTPWPLVHKRTIPTETATCRRNLVPTFVDRGVSRGQRGGSPTVVNLSFLDRDLCHRRH
jgi:hypothetical protein